jgi:hypothetical protein
VESGRRCQRWCSEPLSSSVLHQRRLSRHHKVWDLEDIEHLRTWPALCRSAPVPTGFAATPSAPRAVLRAQGAHTPLLHTTGSSLHISIDCGSVGAGGRRKLQHGGGLCGSGAASASGAAFNWERGQSVAPLSQIENRDESRLSRLVSPPGARGQPPRARVAGRARDGSIVKFRLHFCPLENHLVLVNLKVANYN